MTPDLAPETSITSAVHEPGIDNARRLTLLISTSDIFFDVWHPFFHFMFKYWPGLNFPIRLVTNHFQTDPGPIRHLAIGDDKGWAHSLTASLQQIDSEFVFYSMEDIFITRPVDAKQFEEDVRFCEENRADYLAYRTSPENEEGFQPVTDRIGLIGRDSNHRAKADPAIWRRSTLLKLIEPNESPWHFLKYASERCRDVAFYRCSSEATATIGYLGGSAIRRSLWRQEGLKMLRDENIKIKAPYRGTHTKLNGLLPSIKRSITKFAYERNIRKDPNRLVPLNALVAQSLGRNQLGAY